MNALKLYFFIGLFSVSFSLFSQERFIYTSKFIDLYSGQNRSLENSKTGRLTLLNFYSRFISSQDHTDCMFYPSCSVYMSESIKKNGVFAGIIKGLDRLIRCNGVRTGRYDYTSDHKMIDLP
jgi:uncharacterized protein